MAETVELSGVSVDSLVWGKWLLNLSLHCCCNIQKGGPICVTPSRLLQFVRRDYGGSHCCSPSTSSSASKEEERGDNNRSLTTLWASRWREYDSSRPLPNSIAVHYCYILSSPTSHLLAPSLATSILKQCDRADWTRKPEVETERCFSQFSCPDPLWHTTSRHEATVWKERR